MIVTDDERLAQRCRSLRNLCFRPGRRFVHDELGWTFRMTSLQAAVGLAQLERMEGFAARKRAIGARYRSLLAAHDWLQLPLAATDYADNIYWVFGVLSRDGSLDADECMRRLHELGIGTRPFFWPMHEQPVFQGRGWFAGESYPNAERLARTGFYLPSGLTLTDAQIDRSAAALSGLRR